MNHLRIMESLGGDRRWIDRFSAQHAAFIYYWVRIISSVFILFPVNSAACASRRILNFSQQKPVLRVTPRSLTELLKMLWWKLVTTPHLPSHLPTEHQTRHSLLPLESRPLTCVASHTGPSSTPPPACLSISPGPQCHVPNLPADGLQFLRACGDACCGHLRSVCAGEQGAAAVAAALSRRYGILCERGPVHVSEGQGKGWVKDVNISDLVFGEVSSNTNEVESSGQACQAGTAAVMCLWLSCEGNSIRLVAALCGSELQCVLRGPLSGSTSFTRRVSRNHEGPRSTTFMTSSVPSGYVCVRS